MKWKTFLQIVLLLIIAKVLFEIGMDKQELYEKPKYQDASLKVSRDIDKSRYQYTGIEKSYLRISLTDPNTNKSTYEYVPVENWGVFDTWDGKLYTTNDLTNEIILEKDIINQKIKVHLFPKGSYDLPPEVENNIDWDKMQDEIKIRLEREHQKEKEDLLKSLLQSKN
ncbi:MAG: hypothetical protein PHW62_07685 [Candidatus Ratteibacteria bacterium]|nr:hypothetical protein [Candidatus Ratteibacteria bacterium]